MQSANCARSTRQSAGAALRWTWSPTLSSLGLCTSHLEEAGSWAGAALSELCFILFCRSRARGLAPDTDLHLSPDPEIEKPHFTQQKTPREVGCARGHMTDNGADIKPL